MPAKTWTTQADFQSWTLIDLVATAEGTLALAEGVAMGTGRSPAYEATGWNRWGRLRFEVEQPVGTSVYVRWRSGATESACLAADWSPWDDVTNDDGVINLDLGLYYRNNPEASVGAWVQIEVDLLAE